MRRAAAPLLLLVAACSQPDPKTSSASTSAPTPCTQQQFEGSRFTLCSAKGGKIEIRTAGQDGRPYRSFVAIEAALGKRAGQVAFAMNAGMFDEAGDAIGLLVEDGKQLHAINTRKGGGNFHLLPNGAFLIRRDGSAAVVTAGDYTPARNIEFATQSGPMLVIAGKLHPKFEPDGQSRNIRNGVGIAPDGKATFIISEDFVSLGKFARFFRDSVKAKNALYFDGSISSLWDPANARRDTGAELGPMVVVFSPAASAPGP